MISRSDLNVNLLTLVSKSLLSLEEVQHNLVSRVSKVSLAKNEEANIRNDFSFAFLVVYLITDKIYL